MFFSKKMEKCLYFWLNYIRECSTLTFSEKNGKVFVFLVKLYKRVFHPNIFSHMVNFLSLWGWESDWSPTGCQMVAYFLISCLGTGCMLHDVLRFCSSIAD